ncbi:MAG: hypothetical protein K2K94_06450 [Muribaculaceae bacterium]|nr:hypothetical protein [Muribaculaceae bacterium]
MLEYHLWTPKWKQMLKDYVVEQEGTDGSHTIMEGVAMDADYLRKADYVKAEY